MLSHSGDFTLAKKEKFRKAVASGTKILLVRANVGGSPQKGLQRVEKAQEVRRLLPEVAHPESNWATQGGHLG
jgi:hypothetical protein